FFAGALVEKALYDPVLERVEGDDHQPAARLQAALGGGKTAGKLAQLVVDVDSQRLERLRGGMAIIAAPAADGARNELGQRARGGDRSIFSARLDDQTRNDARAALLAQNVKNAREIFLVRLVDDIGCR